MESVIERPECPTCGEGAVQYRCQEVRHIDPGAAYFRVEAGEKRYVCPNGHFYDLDGNACGTEMPPNITVDHLLDGLREP